MLNVSSEAVEVVNLAIWERAGFKLSPESVRHIIAAVADALPHLQAQESTDKTMSAEAARMEFVDRMTGTVDPDPDIRWAINVLLEKIAEKFEEWETMDIWRSDAAMVVRSFKNTAVAPLVAEQRKVKP